MDADTVLMQDVAPLLGEDWAYLVKGKEGAVFHRKPGTPCPLVNQARVTRKE